LDMTEEVVCEALSTGCNMVVAHHPIWFTARKRLNGEDHVSRTIMLAVKHDIALYACHTNLDAVKHGVNAVIGQKLGVSNMRSLAPAKDAWSVLVATSTKEAAEKAAGLLEAEGLRPRLTADAVSVTRLECLIPNERRVALSAMVTTTLPGAEVYTHPIGLSNHGLPTPGSGMVGELSHPMSKSDFMAHVKHTFRCGGVRYADFGGDSIQRVAWCGGAGSFLIHNALQAGADAFVTADITYHKFFDAEGRMLLMDIGHFESEQFTSELIARFLSEKFPTFAVRLSKVITNPVKYY